MAIRCACRRAAPPPLSQLCLWSANNLGSIQSIYLTLLRYCHSALSVYLRARTNQEVLWECGSSYFLYCSLMWAMPPSERCFFSSLSAPTVARTCQRQEIYAAFWHFEDVNNFFTCAPRSHCESSGGWQSAGVCWGSNLSLPPSLSLFLLPRFVSGASQRSSLNSHITLDWVGPRFEYGDNRNLLLWLPDWLPESWNVCDLVIYFSWKHFSPQKKLDFPRLLACRIQLDCMRCITNMSWTFLRNSEK